MSFCQDSENIKLVATKLPEGKKMFHPAGQAGSKTAILRSARKCPNRPGKIEAVSAESVGLEWHKNGEKLESNNDNYRKTRWVALFKVNEG